jgi:hypothetical protein
VVSQSLAKFFFPGEDPLERVVYFSTFGKPDGTVADLKNACRVVAVAEDAKYISLRRPAPQILYQLIRLNVLSDYAPTQDGDLLVRAASDCLALAAIRVAAAETLPANASVKVKTFTERVNQDLSRERMVVLLAGVFAMLALLLTALGLYGLLTRWVNLRTREIGIRVALGAQRRAILVELGRRTSIDVAVGLIAGTAAAILLSQAIRKLLDMHATGGFSGCLFAVLLILTVALFAVIPPARRASRIDPMQALRSE